MGRDAEENANITVQVLTGESGPRRNIVLLNAAASMYVSGQAPSIGKGLEMAEKSIDSGDALKKLNEVRKVTNE